MAEPLYESIVEESNDGILVAQDGEIVFANDRLATMTGYTHEELLGSAKTMLVAPEDTELVEGYHRARIEGKSAPSTYDVELETSDGERVPVELSVTRIDVDGEPASLSFCREISERRERERVLHQYEQAVEASEDLIIAIDGDGTYLFANSTYRDYYGVDDVEGRHVSSVVGKDTFESTIRPYHERALAGEAVSYERTGTFPDRGERTLAVTYTPITVGEEVIGLVAIIRDITERKADERALDRAREELRQIIDLVPDLIFAKNRDGEYLLANEATADAYGLTPEEVEGEHEADVIPDLEDSEAFREDDRDVLDTGESKVVEEELTTESGETRILQTTKIPYEVPGSGEDAVLGYARDVTELKEYEQTLEKQRDNLELLNRIVRHDIRNDLQIISTYAETLENYVEDGGEEYRSKILEASQNAVEMTNTARDVTDVMLQSATDLFPVPLHRVLDNTIDDVRSSYDRALVTVDGSLPDVAVLADDMLSSIFKNLLSNAIQHNDKEVPEVHVSADCSDGSVTLTIADNGPGIPDERKAQVFERGESGNGGAGLGLYLVAYIVDSYDGSVRIEDNEPTGAVFHVELPTVEERDG